jgi:hypothetical protein
MFCTLEKLIVVVFIKIEDFVVEYFEAVVKHEQYHDQHVSPIAT